MILMAFCWEIEGATVTCDLQYGFLPCTNGLWGRLFLIVVYQYLMSVGQGWLSNGSDKFFNLVGPGIFGASLFHILGNFPMLYIVLESRLSSDDTGASSMAEMGMSVLAGSAVMSLTLIWPSVIVFGSYDLTDDDETNLPQLPDEELSSLTKLTAYGLTTDSETSYTARLMLVSMIPFLILQLPQIINSPSTRRDLSVHSLYKELDKNHDGKVTSAEFKTLLIGIQVQADGELSQDLVDRIMDQLDITGDESIQEVEFVRNADEEQQEALIPKDPNVDAQSSVWEYLEASALILIGIVVTVLIVRPLITNIVNFATDAHVPSFLIPYFVIPCAIGIPRLLSTIASASQKTHRAASLTLSQIYSGLFMSNMSSLSTFLLTVYIKDVAWDVSAEVLVVLVICVVMGTFTSTRTVFPLWTGFVGYLFYPISILMLYLLTVVWGWS
ncbi:hypothetical protein L1987_02496 [Smallanthus sonchifolius]|uniref:Uncharacterized protein n=1 Tax=Smallanthus sonchifolius TaxID=185202 RepID=A0ACB9K868_9ASTR|nr:hypothetical protein L1987_02496 [Smallanthus sonchifolius]